MSSSSPQQVAALPMAPRGGASSSKAGESAIQVVIRLRPMNENEKRHGTLPVVTAKTLQKSVSVIRGKGQRQTKSNYDFDNVFTAFSTQGEVFEATVQPVIGDVLRGYESTVFAYGQTGTGKTHTMEGSLSSPELYGVIPRSAQAIFEQLKRPEYHDVDVTCSYLEIYNEELRDLLLDGNSSPTASHDNHHYGSNSRRDNNNNNGNNDRPTKLEIREGKNGTPFCRGLSERTVSSAEDVLQLMQKAQQQRIVGETRMNKASSRSHCLFTLKVHGKIDLTAKGGLKGGAAAPSAGGGGEHGTLEFNGKLHMVDLAGSECAKSAGSVPGSSAGGEAARERERLNINRSLLTLGRVISMLKERGETSGGKKSNVRIPYRDSKLTRILQESLGGRCKTVIVATLSPSITAIEESLSTLKYAQSANGIINKPVSSSLISLNNCNGNYPSSSSGAGGSNQKGDSSSSVEEQYSSIEHWQEMECRLQYMQAQVEEAQAALARKHLAQQELVDKADRAESDATDARRQLIGAEETAKSLQADVETESAKRKDAEDGFLRAKMDLRKASAVLRATRETETKLTSEARTLLATLGESAKERSDLHALDAFRRDDEARRREAARDFRDSTGAALGCARAAFDKLADDARRAEESAGSAADGARDAGTKSVEESRKFVEDMAESVSRAADAMKCRLYDDINVDEDGNKGGGIALFATAGAEKALTDVASVRSLFADGEASLMDTCRDARSRLATHAATLDGRSVENESSSANALVRLESSVLGSKNSVERLVARATEVLDELSESKSATTVELHELVERWSDRSVEASDRIADEAELSGESLGRSLDAFRSESGRRSDAVDASLAEQRTFLSNDGDAHVGTVGELGSVLAAQRDDLASLHDRHEELREKVMASIVDSVGVLVSREFSKLAESERERHGLLSRTGAAAAEANGSILRSAKGVVDRFRSTNEALSQESINARTNDGGAATAMEASREAFGRAATESRAQSRWTRKQWEETSSTVAAMEELDAKGVALSLDVRRDGEKCATTLVSSILEPTRADVENARDTTREALSDTKNAVMKECDGTFIKIVTERTDVGRGVNEALAAVASGVQSSTDGVLVGVKAQGVAIAELRAESSSARSKYEHEVAPARLVEMEATRIGARTEAGRAAESSLETATAGAASVDGAGGAVRDFAGGTFVRCDDDVEAPRAMRDLPFSDRLTATPREDVLIRGVDWTKEVEEDGAGPAAAVTAASSVAVPLQTAPEVSSSSSRWEEQQQSQTQDDETSQGGETANSRKSSGSHSSLKSHPSPRFKSHPSPRFKSHPSPGLKARDINVKVPASVGKNMSDRKHLHNPSVTRLGTLSGRKNKTPMAASTPSKKNKTTLISTPSMKRNRVKK